VIRADDVSWTYAGMDRPALRGLTLHVTRGETVVLCGASGSGKSTALRLLNGLIPHFHDGTLTGSVIVAGLSTTGTELDELGRHTGTVLQHPRRQFFTDRADTELAFAMENFGADPRVIRERVATVLEEHDLTGLTGQRLGELSGGQQQRVACAAALAHRPDLLLLDEPTANLSSDAIHRLTTTLRRLRDAGTTVVIAEHRLHFLRELADRVLMLRDGQVHTEWTASQFARLDDTALEAEGLRRRETTTAALPAVTASGRSVVVPTGPGDDAPGLVLRQVRCRLGGQLVLDIDHAHLPAGRVTAVRGPNGAGKSTFARIITGLQPHEGTLELNGQALSRARRQRAGAIVMQDTQRQLFTDSVHAELTLSSGRDAAERIRPLLDRLDLTPLTERHPLSLSGGQQQRLVVATARLTRRPVVVFDEPSSGVDRRHLTSISELIREVAAEGAVTVLISHDEDLLALTADAELRLSRLGRPPA
jgi:energy-coupling factor transport system ATP-binding protein